ncbi:hypothetical protein ACIGZJ_20735 [Kitasatospora sp. NPDC052868]|uniref:hypothetical protein n=1 Tax=Kitasatospora sp. NPDC052868 TaxID=3364060 RepID=UPI0037C689D3
MSDSRALREFLDHCLDSAEKVGFSLADGRDFLGWVAEVEDGRILAAWAPSPFAPEPGEEWLPITAILPGTAARYDRALRRWVEHYG